MRLYNTRGRLVNKNVEKYRIKWDEKSRSNIQYQVKQFLKPFWFGHVVYEEFPVYGARLKVDIINFTRRIAIEVHGDQHFKFNKFFHNNRRAVWLDSVNRDGQKLEWLAKNGVTVIEILQDEVPKISEEFLFEKFQLSLP
jgi:hypothetical protein